MCMPMIAKKNILLKFSIIIMSYTIIWLYPIKTFSYDLLNEDKIKHDLQHAQQSECITHINQKTIVNSLQSALYFINEKKISNNKIKEYQKIINDFPYNAMQLREEYDKDIQNPINTYQNLSIPILKQKLSNVYNQLINLSEQLKQEKDQICSIHESLKLLLQQKTIIKNILNNLEQRQKIYGINIINPLENAKFTAFQAEQSANRLKIVELEFAQLSANNRKELSKLRTILLKKKYDIAHNQLYILKNQLNSLQFKEVNQPVNNIEKIFQKKNESCPKIIIDQLKINQKFLQTIIHQEHYLNEISSKKKEIETNILQAHQIFSDLLEQSQWVNKSPILGKSLRSKIDKLPKIPKFQKLNNDIAQLKSKRLQYENYINKLPKLISNNKQNNEMQLTAFQKNILEKQLNTQHELLILLLNNYNTQILETTKLKLSYEELVNILQEIQESTHRYLFWIADIYPITLSYLQDVYHDTLKFLTHEISHYQIKSTLYIIRNNQTLLILIIFSFIISISLHFGMQYHYIKFLKRSSTHIGKVHQDNILITFHNIWSSMCVAMPIPILWKIIGYKLNHISPHSSSIITSIGEGMNATTFMLWAFITSFYFALPKGLFIMHFGWSKKKIQQFFSENYKWSVTIIMFLTIGFVIFNNYNNKEFSHTLGRLFFILLCIYLTFITNALKQSGFPLYLNKHDSSDNIINYSLWNIMICAPIAAGISCTYGYLFTAQILLTRLETSLFIWALLLIIYHIIRRWMFIQRRRIAFKRAKKKRTIQFFLRTQNDSNISLQSNLKKQLFSNNENDKKVLDLDTISNKSLQLIRSIITLIALLSMTLLWSELRFAFSFLENITLWDVNFTIKGVDNIQPITLNTLIIIIVVIIITTITVRNLPALLELTLLQHLHLSPGTSYAITTLTKYILMLLGNLIGFSLVGIEWNKIQWLIAALGVGLGFGLQEIFANFISGLMILFEKPIRIGDTITIQNITGNVTKINTRATIVTDWDHRETIIPNKEFITKQFINWSLSNSITRITLTIPVPVQIDIDKIPNILLKIIQQSPLALNQPSPEIYLINLNQGFPIFEMRIYTKDIKSRIPLRHQINTNIIQYYKNNGLNVPFLPCCHNKELTCNNSSSTSYNSNTNSTTTS